MTAPDGLDHDWYPGTLPAQVSIHENAYIETTYGLTRIDTTQEPGLVMEEGAGIYSNTAIEIGPQGTVSVGAYTCLNTVHIVCNDRITIGAHCLISWQVVITDTDLGPGISPEAHEAALRHAAAEPDRRLPPLAPPRPVVIEDVVWIGFGSVILPGVTIGRGSIVGCKTVVDRDVPPGVVVAGNPMRVIRTIEVPEADR